MKKIFSAIASALLCAGLFAVSSNEASLASEMVSAYSSGFYPGVVRYADEILKSGNSSVFTGKALVYKGESLFRMGRVRESLLLLEGAADAVKDNTELSAARLFWIGRGLFALEKNEAAIQYFYKSCDLFLKVSSEKPLALYEQSVYYSGKTFRRLEKYNDSADCFEYVVNHGNNYSLFVFEDAAVNFVDCLVLSGQFEKADKIAENLEGTPVSEDAKYRLILSKGQALEGLKKYEQAYFEYCKVLSEGPVSLAAVAMQKAYTVSSEHSAQVKEEPGAVISKAQKLLEDKPGLVSEFWIRLAVDSFNSKNYEKALTYFTNAENGITENGKQLSLLYKTEIQFLTSKKEQKIAAKEALDFLNENWEQCGFKAGDIYYSDGLTVKARYAGLCENWEECASYAESQLSEELNSSAKKTSTYWAALSLYSRGKYQDALDLLNKNSFSGDDFLLLKAKALAKTGKSSEADKIFYHLVQKGTLNNDGRLDYTRTLLNAGHLISTVEQAVSASGSEAEYMKGLALFNRRKWAEAEESFTKVLSGKDLSSKYVNFARFYLGYAQYQRGNFEKAYSNLYAFTGLEKDSVITWDAYITAGRSAVQTGKLDEAEAMAKKAMTFAKNERQKQESILLSAGVYTDSQKYDSAVALLKPHSTLKNDFAYQCQYLIAQIYVKQKLYDMADKVYAGLAAEENAGSLAEEAAFRRGELCYTTEKFEKAVPLFENYTKKYFKGQFYTAAIYFEADSLIKLNRIEKAVLYFQQIVDSPESGSYKYGAEKQLIELYRNRGDYSAALAMARKIIDEYGEQASRDGIPQITKELKSLNSGVDSKLYKLESEYEKAGGIKTPAGRKNGTALAEFYGKSQDSYGKAEKLALSLLELQKKNEAELQYAARNSMLLGEIWRYQGKNKEAAQIYLDAAQYNRKSGNDNEAARALYGAAEAFDAAGLTGDAQATVNKLRELYPSSSYSVEAVKLVK